MVNEIAHQLDSLRHGTSFDPIGRPTGRRMHSALPSNTFDAYVTLDGILRFSNVYLDKTAFINIFIKTRLHDIDIQPNRSWYSKKAPPMNENKCVLIIDETLPPGVIANAAAVLSASLGKLRPEMIGRDLPDRDGYLHQGITTMAIPILKGNGAMLKAMRDQLKEFEPDLLVVDLISATRTTKSYEEYAAVLEQHPVHDLEYLGLALFGDKKTVTKLTGSLRLLR